MASLIDVLAGANPVSAAVGGVVGVIGKVLDKIIPDPAQKAQAALELQALVQSGELKELEISMSAILAEAQSADKWTSRARPGFLYVIYLMLLAALPMGVLSAFKPQIAAAVATGLQAWLAAIPDSLYALFGAGYLGYTGSRSWEKKKGLTK